MKILKEYRNAQGKIEKIETSLTGSALLDTPKLNKGTAFTQSERIEFNLSGKLPERIETIAEQAERVYLQYGQFSDPLQKNIYLNSLHDTNETLFYYLVQQHLEEMLPIIYTPTVGDAVQNYSLQMRRPRGLFISFPEKDRIAEILKNRVNPEVDIIVATDGEGVLGIGDQGIGGMDISIAKLMIYSLCGGLHPNRRLPIQLDVGTNNPQLLNDPMYLGWRHERISGAEYDEFIAAFVDAVKLVLPGVYLHWEDFGRDNARKNLDRYRQHICSFNDDIQGTGAVALAGVLAGINASGVPIDQHRVIVFGAGTAGVGIADQIADAMVRYGVPKQEAYRSFYLIDREGLLIDDMLSLMDFQKPYARSRSEVAGWQKDEQGKILLDEVVRQCKPTVLIGCSTVAGAFKESIIKTMAASCQRPIILPLSNPTSKAEAHPANLLEWTKGQALVASGSPFGSIDWQNKTIRIAQCNNALIFPGIGMGVIISKADCVTDNMLWAASSALAGVKVPDQALLPGFSDVINVSHKIARAVADQAVNDGVAKVSGSSGWDTEIQQSSWYPAYYPYQKV